MKYENINLLDREDAFRKKMTESSFHSNKCIPDGYDERRDMR